MSTTLTWRPLQKNAGTLGDELKHVLRRYFGGAVARQFTESDVGFLHGIAAAGNEEASRDAERLIAIIERHGVVELSEES